MEKILTEKMPPRLKTQKRIILKAAGQLLPALIGFMLGSVSFDGRIFPFGAAFAGGASDDRLLSVCLGAAAGALVFCPHSAALKYAGACVLLFFLRTSALKNIKENSKPRVYPLLTFACVLICSLVLALAFSTELSGLILEVCDAVIAGTCAFFSYRVFSVVGSGGRFACITSGDTAALMLWGSLILLSLNKLCIGGFSPARVVTFLCVMLLSFCGKESTGTAAGVCAGTVFGLSDGTPHLLFALPLSGLLCGLCAEYGKPAVAAAFAVSDILALIMKGSPDTLMTSACECLAAALIFALLPKRAIYFFNGLILPFTRAGSGETAKKTLTARMNRSASAVREMADCVEAVCRMLSRTDVPDIGSVPPDVKEDVCEDCLKYDFCWKHAGAITLRSFEECLRRAEQRGRLLPEDLPERLGIVCREKNALCDSFNRLICEHNARLTARSEIFEAKALAASQFRCAADIMDDASREAARCEEDDARLHSVIAGVFTSLGFEFSELLVSGTRSGRCSAEIFCTAVPREKDYNVLTQKLTAKTGIGFMQPFAEKCGNGVTVLRICEKTALRVRSCKLSRTGDGEKLCGDCCELFSDGKGYFYSVLSDGMGTGSRAALDSVMTCSLFSRLMKAGFTPETAFSAVNSALAVKSADESLATLDILKLDLFTGEAEFYKAGSVFSAVFTSGKVGIVEKASMPLGILRETHFERSGITLKKGDTVIMISDGAQSLGTGFFRELLTARKSADVKEICSLVVDAAVKASPSGRADDITAACIKII